MYPYISYLEETLFGQLIFKLMFRTNDDLKLKQLQGITFESTNDYEGKILNDDDN